MNIEDFAVKSLLVSGVMCLILVMFIVTLGIMRMVLTPKVFCGYYMDFDETNGLYSIYADIRFDSDQKVYIAQDRTEALFAYALLTDKSKYMISKYCYDDNSFLKFPMNLIKNYKKLVSESFEKRKLVIKNLATQIQVKFESEKE